MLYLIEHVQKGFHERYLLCHYHHTFCEVLRIKTRKRLQLRNGVPLQNVFLLASSIWSFHNGHDLVTHIVHGVANEVESLERLYAMLPLLIAGIRPTIVRPTRSSGHHVFERHAHFGAAHIGELHI